ncbi:MAG: hypothetical protein N2484_06850 [Clostridia bacterium]|nr:hypothetical protein [Clostridia bacterium]
MKQKIFALFLAVVFLFSQISIVDAKGRSGGGFSSKSSSGYSGSSRKSSAGSSFSGSKSSSSTAKSSSGYSGSSSRSVPGSYSKSSPSSSKSTAPNTGSTQPSGAAPKSTKTNTMKNTYMADTYKKQASTRNYKTYQQKLNDEQKKAYDTSFNRGYRVNNRMNFEDAMRTRPQRISRFDQRPVRIYVNNNYFGGPLSYGSAFVGPWDLWFLMRASDLFWYHHWHDIYAHRDYFEAAKFAEMEARVRELERKHNGVRDENYLDPDVDPDLQFSDEYTNKNLDNVYLTNKYARPSVNPFVVFIIILAIGIVMIVIIRKVSRPKPKAPFNSRIY